MAAESADIDGTSTSTSFSEKAYGATPAMSTVEQRMKKEVGAIAMLASAAWSSMLMSFVRRASASSTGICVSGAPCLVRLSLERPAFARFLATPDIAPYAFSLASCLTPSCRASAAESKGGGTRSAC
eukprot:scaffold56430_cov32-Tisochrysis_lutea.AAC.1